MVEWITEIVTTLGYLGIAFLMLLENLFPPIPSEVIMGLAGFAAGQPQSGLSLAGVVAAGVVGTMLGALPWYWVGHRFGEARLVRWADRWGRWLGVTGEDLGAAMAWFRRRGRMAVFFGRLVPGVRTLISVPAGVAGMKFWVFFGWSALGSTIWCGLLATAGWVLGDRWPMIEAALGGSSKWVLGGLALAGLGFLAWRKLAARRRGPTPSAAPVSPPPPPGG